MCILLVTLTVACLVSASELALFLMCTLLVTLTVAGLVQWVSWPGLMYTLLVTLTVACLVSGSELALFLMCTFLVTRIVACLVSECELSWFQSVLSGDTDFSLSCFRE